MRFYTVEADRERLDRIARDIFGSERGGTVEALLAANPGLAATGFFLPRGRRIRVPERPVPASRYVRPWE